MSRRGRLAGAVLLVTSVAGCGTLSGADGRDHYPAVELASVPFFAQQQFQCGPAALASLLVAAGDITTPQALAPQSYLPERHGSLQLELVATARRHGRVPYELPGTIDALLAELVAGHPVLVLQNFGSRDSPRWHYAVVIGYEPGHARMLLRSGAQARERMPLARFAATWERAGRWALVVLEPPALPADDDPTRYLEAVAGVESIGQRAVATRAYRAALARWPGAARAALGLGNVAAADARWADATQAYRDALALSPEDAAARNNLAIALSRQGCRAAALQEIERARADAGGGPLAAEIAASRAEIEAAAPSEAGSCPVR